MQVLVCTRIMCVHILSVPAHGTAKMECHILDYMTPYTYVRRLIFALACIARGLNRLPPMSLSGHPIHLATALENKLKTLQNYKMGIYTVIKFFSHHN